MLVLASHAIHASLSVTQML